MFKNSWAVPAATFENCADVVLRFPSGEITLGELKSILMIQDMSEANVLMKEMKVTKATLNWIVDSVVSGFLFVISDLVGSGRISVSVAEAQHLLCGMDCSSLFTGDDGGSYCDWNNVSEVFIPFNKSKNHWILLILNPKEKIVEGKFRFKQVPYFTKTN